MTPLKDEAANGAADYQLAAEKKPTGLPFDLSAPALPVRGIAVIGAGTMGCGIAIAALDAGLSVALLEQDPAALERGRLRVLDHYAGRVKASKLAAETADQRQSRLAATVDWGSLREADLVIEAVFEEIGVKRLVFSKMDQFARPGAVLATNTSYLDIDDIAAATSRPADVVGLHFFSPANVMKLLEVVRGRATAPHVLSTGMALGRAMGKVPVLAGNAFGFIGNRVYNAYRRQCEFLLEDGAWPEDVDAALKGFGFAMGPFAVADLSGLDIAWRMRKAQAANRDARERYVPILDELCEMGRLGRKTGMGYYRYVDGQQEASADAPVRDVIARASKARGVDRRAIDAREIQRRALVAIVNEAALLLAEGVATRASDIDVVMVRGYGFPAREGGPVYWARKRGRDQLEHDLRELATACGHGFVAGNLDLLLSHS